MAVSSASATANSIGMDFMKLLVAQLQNQNPMEPLNNNEMASQLAQLSSLEQLEMMNGSFQQVLAGQQKLQAMALIGKEVEFLPEGATEAVRGRVQSVEVYDEGIRLSIGEGGYVVDLSDVQSIRG